MIEMSKRDPTEAFGALLVSLGLVTAEEVEDALAAHRFTGNRLGEELLSLGYITRTQLHRALATSSSSPLVADRPRLGEVLIGLEHLSEPQLEAALVVQREDGRPLGELLVERGECTYEEVFEALTEQHRITAPAVANLAQSKSTRVMLVDDSVVVCGFVKKNLTQLGYDVVSFLDPLRALEQLAEVNPDIVVTDLEMPGLNGDELCRRIKAGPSSHLPVIILTANESEAPLLGLQAGADDYVRKGTSMEEVAARIDGIVRRTTATQKMRKLFARYTSDAVVDQVLSEGDVVLTGEKREVTILFADIRNFTSLAETLDPGEVMSALNDALGRLADCVLSCGGTVDKFLGDGLMAVFGAPVTRDEDARWALTAARQMVAAMRDRNATTTPRLEIGIGINSGMVVAGSLGNERRTDYTVIGDAVNVAARLCSLAGEREILVGEGTAQRLADSGLDALPPVKLKGKAQPVPLFRVREAS
jgi:adenylate cyclase